MFSCKKVYYSPVPVEDCAQYKKELQEREKNLSENLCDLEKMYEVLQLFLENSSEDEDIKLYDDVPLNKEIVDRDLFEEELKELQRGIKD